MIFYKDKNTIGVILKTISKKMYIFICLYCVIFITFLIKWLFTLDVPQKILKIYFLNSIFTLLLMYTYIFNIQSVKNLYNNVKLTQILHLFNLKLIVLAYLFDKLEFKNTNIIVINQTKSIKIGTKLHGRNLQ